MNPTLVEVGARVAYFPETGEFIRVITAGGKVRGTVAGATNADGYVILRIKYRDLYAHRLAFLFMEGAMPELVDHINGNRADNRWCNLRASSKTLNAQNLKGAMRHNRTGFLGVSPSCQNERFEARIKVNGQQRFLGEHDTPEQAHAAYLEAKRRLHAANTL